MAHFVTSPNMDHIYAPPDNIQMTFNRDLRLGDDDILLWPQPYFAQNPHFAAIPRQPEGLTIEHKHYICFYVTTDRDFVCREDGPVSGLGHLHPKLLWLAKQLYSHLDRLHDRYQNDLCFPKKTPFFSHLLGPIKRSLVHLERLPVTRRQIRFVFAEMQRCMLEFIGGHDYIYIYKPRMDGEKPPATEVAHTIGAFVQSVTESETFFLAGLPVWLVRPAKLAGTVHVDALVALAKPKDFLCLEDNFRTYPIEFCGPPTSSEKYQVFGHYSRSFLSYSNPFIASKPAESSPASTSASTSCLKQP